MDTKYYRGIIYMYTSPSGKIYIGKTSNEELRKQRHRLANRNTVFHAAIRKYGFDNFKYEILLRTSSKDKQTLQNVLSIFECYYIKKYNSTKKEIGYNRTLGGDGGCYTEISLKTRAKMSSSRQGHTYGKKIAVKLWTTKGELLNTYNSIKQAHLETGVHTDRIRLVCKHEDITAGGYVWTYANEDFYIRERRKTGPKNNLNENKVLTISILK